MIKVAIKHTIKVTGIIFAISLAGCYGNWPQLSTVADAIDCKMSRQQIESIAVKNEAYILWDEASNSLTLAKHDDAITVVFDSKRQRIDVVAKTQSLIGSAGLSRQQGDVIIVKRCEL